LRREEWCKGVHFTGHHDSGKVSDHERHAHDRPDPGHHRPSFLCFAADDSRFNVISNRKSLTVPIPQFDVPTASVGLLVRFLSGQRIDDTDGIEFVDQTDFCRDPATYLRAFLMWKTRTDDPTAQPPAAPKPYP